MFRQRAWDWYTARHFVLQALVEAFEFLFFVLLEEELSIGQARANPQLAENRRHMGLDGRFRNAQLIGDLFVQQAFADHGQHPAAQRPALLARLLTLAQADAARQQRANPVAHLPALKIRLKPVLPLKGDIDRQLRKK